MAIRLDKMLAHCGYGSRKEVKEFIRRGNVDVNGVTIYDDDFKVDENIDEVIVDEQIVEYSKLVYIMLNKPEDVVSATYDKYKKTVLELLDGYEKQNLFPIGRLDIDTTGLLLISNDGKLAHKLLAPKSHVDKTYYVEFEGEFKEQYFDKFKKGITLDDGYVTKDGSIELISKNSANITIHEGKFHQVKRMFEALNMKVIKLRRIKFGPLSLDESLLEGQYRLLTEKEIELLKVQ